MVSGVVFVAFYVISKWFVIPHCHFVFTAVCVVSASYNAVSAGLRVVSTVLCVVSAMVFVTSACFCVIYAVA